MNRRLQEDDYGQAIDDYIEEEATAEKEISLDDDALRLINHKIQVAQDAKEAAQDTINRWEMVKEAMTSERDPCRDRMVIRTSGEYVATYRSEINPNGWLTAQLVDGSIMPTQLGSWCPYNFADEYFGIERNEIQIDDPQSFIGGDDGP
jgi:hypothetical protein